MKQSQHTPGPWEIRADPCHYDSFTTVVAGSGEQRKGLLRELIVEVGGWADIEVAEANARLIAAAPDMLAELMNYCAECCGNGSERCAFYDKSGDMCRMAQNGTCDTWMTICRATGHDPATPWEVTK
jgi:hypothetical protein